MMCYICNDVKRAETKKIHAKRVLSSLERLVPLRDLNALESSRQYKKDVLSFERQLSHSKNNVNLMCGRCIRFNESEFKTIEKNINKRVAYILAYIIKIREEDTTKAVKIKSNLCAILRGQYATAYRLVERTYVKYNLKENENEII